MAAVEVLKLPDDDKYHVVMTVVCEDGHVIGQWLDTIAEKYPFYCPECQDIVNRGKYPWSLMAQSVMCHGQVAVIDAPPKG